MPKTVIPNAAQRLRALLASASPPDGQVQGSGLGPGRYDRLIDAANRLPRPVLVYGTVALMFLALIRPDLFDRGMASLDRMPEELWWLVGAILAGHFGAREAHHLRHRHDHAPKAPPDKPAEKPVPAGKA